MNQNPQNLTSDKAANKDQKLRSVGKWLPLGIVVAAIVIVFAMGWHEYLSLEKIGMNYDMMRDFIKDNLALSVLAFMALYVAVVALSLPGALAMTLAGGILFGWMIGAPASVVAATIGSVIIFLIAKTSLGELLAAKAGPTINKLREGFQEDELGYMFFLRLVPAFPLFVVNLAPALLGVKFRNYFIGTFFGIIPGSIAFSFAASQLGTVIERTNQEYAACIAEKGEAACTYAIDTTALGSTEIKLALVALGVVALIPIVVKRFRKSKHST